MAQKKHSQLQPFKSGSDPRRNLRGRPKKLISVLTAEGYSLTQVIDTIGVLLALSLDELKFISDDRLSEYSALERIVAQSLLRDHRYGRLDALSILLDRCYGKAVNKIQDVSPEQKLFCTCGEVHG